MMQLAIGPRVGVPVRRKPSECCALASKDSLVEGVDHRRDDRGEEEDQDRQRPQAQPAVDPGQAANTTHCGTALKPPVTRLRTNTNTPSTANTRTAMADPSATFCASRYWSAIKPPISTPLSPPSSAGITYSPVIGTNVSSTPATTPGLASGSVTRRKVRTRPAPRSLLASPISWGIRSKAT